MAVHPGEFVHARIARTFGPGRLIADLLQSVRGGERLSAGELLALAHGLAPAAHLWPELSSPLRRSWDLMAVSESFEAWVVAWPEGGRIDLHDHGPSSGAVVVADGELCETVVVDDRSGAARCEAAVVGTGEAVSFSGNHVHELVNVADGAAMSVHVYSPRLTSMTYFDLVDGRLEPACSTQLATLSGVP